MYVVPSTRILNRVLVLSQKTLIWLISMTLRHQTMLLATTVITLIIVNT
jgi:hypothetical protein